MCDIIRMAVTWNEFILFEQMSSAAVRKEVPGSAFIETPSCNYVN